MAWTRVRGAGDGGKGIHLGMLLKTEKIGLADGADNDREERKKSKATPGYFGLSTWGGWGTVAPLTEVWKTEGRTSFEGSQSQEFSFSHVNCAMPLRHLPGHESGVAKKV